MEQKLAQTAFDASVNVAHGVVGDVEVQNYGCAAGEPSLSSVEANDRTGFGNAAPERTYFAAMGLLQHTC